MQECPGGVCPALQGYQLKDHPADPLVGGFSCFKETDTSLFFPVSRSFVISKFFLKPFCGLLKKLSVTNCIKILAVVTSTKRSET